MNNKTIGLVAVSVAMVLAFLWAVVTGDSDRAKPGPRTLDDLACEYLQGGLTEDQAISALDSQARALPYTVPNLDSAAQEAYASAKAAGCADISDAPPVPTRYPAGGD